MQVNFVRPKFLANSATSFSKFLANSATWGVLVCLLIAPTAAEAVEPQVTQVGPVKATVTLTPEQPTIGDEIVLEIKVESEPAVELLMPEFGEALERYTILDFVPKQQIDKDGRTVTTQRYTLQPFLSGEQSIPPILIEFVDNRPGKAPSPDDFDAYELLTARIDFTVKSVLPDSAANQLQPPLGELEINSLSGRSRFWGMLITIILVLAALIAAIYFAKRARTRIQRRNAYELARGQVDRLVADRQSVAPTLSIEQFYVEISAVIRRYLENRFEVRAPELTTDEFLQLAAAESELSGEHQQLLAEFLNQADRVKFASGVLSSSAATDLDVARSSELAIRFLEETRENAPDVIVNSETASDTGFQEPSSVSAPATTAKLAPDIDSPAPEVSPRV